MTYNVPATLIIAVLATENGHNGTAKVNTNGTIDYGPMQINSIWLPELKKYGYSCEDIQYNPCLNVKVGSWILSRAIANNGILWTGVGDYHSRQPTRNDKYNKKVKALESLLVRYLSSAVDPMASGDHVNGNN